MRNQIPHLGGTSYKRRNIQGADGQAGVDIPLILHPETPKGGTASDGRRADFIELNSFFSLTHKIDQGCFTK